MTPQYEDTGNDLLCDFEMKVADTFYKRLKGLMFKKRALKKEGLLIVPCQSIHMFFMKFPIDVVFVDKEGGIVETIKAIKPWRISPIVKSAYATIELPVGTIDAKRIEKGKTIHLSRFLKNK